MDARERSFLEEAQRQVASGRSVDALVAVTIDGDGVRIEENAGGETRLYYAARKGLCAAITWLLEQGADVNVGWPRAGETPLHDAAYRGHCDAAVLLLDAGARVDDRNRYGNTALHRAAAMGGHTNMCKLLLSRGASLDVRNNSGDDPEGLVRHRGRTATADLLAAVRAAGGWRPYCDAPFLELRRELRAPGAVAESSERLCASSSLPNAVFPRVLAFRPDF
ncbi:SET domain-containing protein [Aureococcus anophagefferens]|nr:SET domain-containing protein [Aureococcus anophagefferens]